MQGKICRLRICLVFLALFALLSGGGWADGKAQDFKSKAFTVKEKDKVVVALSFPAGKEAVVTERGAKKTDVHLLVYDAAKKLVTKDDSPGPNCDVKFTPRSDATYTIEIDNLGPGDNSCTLKVEVAK